MSSSVVVYGSTLASGSKMRMVGGGRWLALRSSPGSGSPQGESCRGRYSSLKPDLLLPCALSCVCPAGQWVGPAQPRFLAMAKEYGVGIYEAPQVGILPSLSRVQPFSPSLRGCVPLPGRGTWLVWAPKVVPQPHGAG